MLTAVLTALYPYKFLILYYIITRALIVFGSFVEIIKISAAFMVFCSSERMEFFNQKKVEIEKDMAASKVYAIFKNGIIGLIPPFLELGILFILPMLFRSMINDYFNKLQASLKNEKVKAEIKKLTEARKWEYSTLMEN